jgi:hypothetical protein
MKRQVKRLGLGLASLVALGLGGGWASVQAQDVAGQETVRIKGVRFAESLLERWVAEYAKVHPEASLTVAEKSGEEYTLEVVPFGKDESEVAGKRAILFGRYAVLPIAGKDNVLLGEVQKKKLNGKRLKSLFFERDYLSEEEEAPEKGKLAAATVYSSNGSRSVSHVFAAHFGYEVSSLKGKKIAGDDIYLNSAVTRDATGFSFNSLSYVFDIETRQLREGLALLPLDVKKDEAEVLFGQDLDGVITLLEERHIDLIPVDGLAFVLPEHTDAATLRFVKWALTDGQEYIHPYGFLRPETKQLAQAQKELSALETDFLANK